MLNDYYRQCCLLIFISHPGTSFSWPALTETKGLDYASAMYNKACLATRKITDNLPMEKRIIYRSSVDTNDGWPLPLYSKYIASGNESGMQLSDAFANAFNDGYRKVVMISLDCPGLNAKHLEEAFLSMRVLEFSIGPGSSGSYYLLGMNHFEPLLFTGKPWYTDSLLKNTIKEIGLLKGALYKLPVLHQYTTNALADDESN